MLFLWVYVRTIAIVTQNKYNMNQKFETLNREGQLYEAPFVSVVDIHSEGLLCVSSQGGVIDDATEENWGEF